MELDVQLSSSTSAALRSLEVVGKPTDAGRIGASAKNSPHVSSSSESSVHAARRKRQDTRRSSSNSASSSKRAAGVQVEDDNKSTASQKRRRKSRQLPHEGQEYAGSSLFTMPSSSTRARHLTSRRYSPSPDSRPGAKLKNLMTKLKVKETSGRKRSDFSLARLSKEYDLSSSIILGSLQCDPVNFDFRVETEDTGIAIAPEHPRIVVPISLTNVQPASSTTPNSNHPCKTFKESAVKEEALSVKSSDDEGDDVDDEPTEPVVRMADIGAAPFTPTPMLPLPAPLTAKPMRRFKPSAPVIKLPRRRTFDFANRVDVSERSSLTSTSSADDTSKTREVRRRRRTVDDLESTDSSFSVVPTPEEHLPIPLKRRKRRTVVTVIENVHTPLAESVSLEQSCSQLDVASKENKSENSTSQSTSVETRRKSRHISREKRRNSNGRQDESSSKNEELVAKRPRRLSAGKTINFLADANVVKTRGSSVGTRSKAKPVAVAEMLCSNSEDASNRSKESDSTETCEVVPPRPAPNVSKDMLPNEVKPDLPQVLDEPKRTEKDSQESPEHNAGSGLSANATLITEDRAKEGKNILCESKSTASEEKFKPHSVHLKTTEDGKARILAGSAEGSSSLCSSRKSSSLLNIRRSSRNHTLTEKMRDLEHQGKHSGSSTPTTSRPVDPNSALGILQRVSRFSRPIRSPSPQPLQTVLPRSRRRNLGSTDQQQSQTSNVEQPPHSDENASLECEDRNSDQPFVLDKTTGTVAKGTEIEVTLSSCDSTKPGTLDEKESATPSSPACSKVTSANEEVELPTPAGRSSRLVKPCFRFANEDFVSPLRKRRGSKSAAVEITTGKGKDTLTVDSPQTDTIESPNDEPKPSNVVDATHRPVDHSLNAAPLKTSPKPATFGIPVHTMETRRRSIGKKARPIKIKLRLGNFPRVIAVNPGNETKTDVSETPKPAVSEPPVIKKPAKKYNSPWSRYIPSVKPVLGNIYYSDGTVEKLGVSVNAVMDRLLAEVCQDGITRHSAIVNKREKRKRNIEKARERVARLKEEKTAREAQGWVTKQAKNTYPSPIEGSPDSNELAPRVRGNILQKDFLYPSLKRGTKAEKRKNDELRRARSRRVMSQLAGSALEEKDILHTGRRGSAPNPANVGRLREPSPFDPEKQERLRLDAEERERQKRLTMPISFNTFLSSKTSVLVAQPLLQPQRVNDRAAVADHFYRELLCENTSTGEPVEDSWTEFDMDIEDCLDVTTIEAVHIPKFDDYVAPPELDETAEPVAAKVEQMLLRPSLYAEEDGIAYLYERALEQPELRRNLLSMAIDCISALHVARLSACGREAAVIVYNTVTHQASKMRDVICMFNKDREEAVFWMHRYLIEMLPVELLASYLFLLRHTRLLNCQVKSIVRSTQNECTPWPEVTRIIGRYVEENVVEPDAADLDRTIAPASHSDVIFVLVAPNISVGDFSVRDRFHDPVFKWLRDIGHPASSIVRIKIDETYSTAISEMVYSAVNLISRVVTKTVREHRQKRVVLVGWGTTCCFNHMVLSSVPGVSAVIDLAFPVLSLDGPRGEPDDDILLTYCPSLFVVGSQACDYHPGAMKMMRSSMIMPSGLVVIGHANNNLLVSCATLSRLRITQRVISRCIVEQISDFLGMEWTKRERSRLVPMTLNDTFKVDLMQLKIDEKAAQASRKPKDDSLIRKKKLSGTPLQSPVPREASPSPLPISQLESVRSNFQTLLKKAGTEERLLSSAFKEPRLPVKPTSRMTSPVPRTDSPNLLDPASISLI
ncbi:hypothetical protein RB195_013842 [Necator americanus]|uniref:KANSL3 helical domain-containing protein n=1 Tax=Necator americanus TaxID=51031 RepID=A0ABR1DYZ6_NECAM